MNYGRYLNKEIQGRFLNQRYQNLMEIKNRTAILRKRISQVIIRLVCIPLKAKDICAICEEQKITLSHYRTRRHVDSEEKRGL